jgi:hypothetical protein
VRTDPTDTGGLFVRRRPGTAPVHYRAAPEEVSPQRRRVDAAVAGAILALMTLVAVLFWGPLPVAWLWVGSRIDYWTDSISLGILVAFLGLLATLMGGLMVLRRLDQLWILARRAAGHDQRTGMLGPIFAVSAIIGATLFSIWLIFIAGLGSSLGPNQ